MISGLKISISGLKILISGFKISISGPLWAGANNMEEYILRYLIKNHRPRDDGTL